MEFAYQILQAKGEHAGIPERVLFQIFLRPPRVRLLAEFPDVADMLPVLGNNVAILVTWISGFHAKQRQVGPVFLHEALQRMHGLIIVVLDERVYRADDDALRTVHPLLVMEVCGRQRDGRKRVPPGRFHADGHVLADLVVYRADLRLAGRNRNSNLRIRLDKLPAHALCHGLVFTPLIFQQGDKLLAADVVGQRPQPLPASTRQNNHVHKTSIPPCPPNVTRIPASALSISAKCRAGRHMSPHM